MALYITTIFTYQPKIYINSVLTPQFLMSILRKNHNYSAYLKIIAYFQMFEVSSNPETN